MDNNEKDIRDKMMKNRLKLMIAIVVVLAILAIIVSCSDFITDLIWFSEVGYTSVFLTEIFT